MEETEKILIEMGFENTNNNVWSSQWFGTFILAKTATPQDLAIFIFDRGYNKGQENKKANPSIENTINASLVDVSKSFQ